MLLASEGRAGLIEQVERLGEVAAGGGALPPAELPAAGAFPRHRLGIFASRSEELAARCQMAAERLRAGQTRIQLGQEVVYGEVTAAVDAGQVAFVFPGFEVSGRGLAEELAAHFSGVRAWLEEDRDAAPGPLIDQDGDVLPREAGELLERMQSMLEGNLAPWRVLDIAGVAAGAMAGHSYGEHALLVASGMVENRREAMALLRRVVEKAFGFRSRSSYRPVSTLAVSLTPRLTLDDLLRLAGDEVTVSLDNCPAQKVLSGPEETMKRLEEEFRARGGVCFRMPELGFPVHTASFPIPAGRLEEIYGRVRLREPGTRVYSATSAARMPASLEESRRLLAAQWRNPVRFRETVEAMYADGIRIFVELGPDDRITGFVRDTLRGRDALALAVHQAGRPAREAMLAPLLRLWTRGVAVRWEAMASVLGPGDSAMGMTPEIGAGPTAAGGRKAMEEALLQLAAEQLELSGTELIDIRQGFAQMGLNSLGAVELAARASQQFGIELEETAAFNFPTVEKLAAEIERRLEPGRREGGSKPRRAPEFVTEPVAIIGMGMRYPGGIDTPEAFWRLLCDGRDAVGRVPEGRWPEEPSPRPRIEAGGFLGDVSGFDAAFFGISPREAETMDPQQRLLLEMTWEALEEGGIDPDRLRGTRTGVFAGISSNDYASRLSMEDRIAIHGYMGTGNAQSIAAGRVAFLFGWCGPALAVDTACSSSLAAVHLACQSLRLGECDTAIAGGVNLMLSAETTIYLESAHALSPSGRCRSFDAEADGYVRAEGCGLVVLRRLSDAVAQGDRIWAVIRGSAMNHDGRSSGLTVPNGAAQESVLKAALDAAGAAAGEVGYVEAHGTGTPLGDPIEAQALGAVYGDSLRVEPLPVGSLKSNLGHLEAGAGVAALMKAALMVRHGEFVPSLHVVQPNPRVNWEQLGVRVETRRTPWPEDRRLAGVSSFGMSGTNVHLILESPPAAGAETNKRDHAGATEAERADLLVISAESESALEELKNRYAALLEETAGKDGSELAAVCATSRLGRAHLRRRFAAVGDSRDAMLARLREPAGRNDRMGRPRVAFLFSGQGAQREAMARELLQTEAEFRRALEACDAAVRVEGGVPGGILGAVEGASAASLRQTGLQQPVLFAIEYGLLRLWRRWGVEPEMVAGHSLGEFAAAVSAGVMDLSEAMRLVVRRARAMQSACAAGAMIAVRASEAVAAGLRCVEGGSVELAAINRPDSVVLSGAAEAIEAAGRELSERGIAWKRLAVSHAFHSRLMRPAAREVAAIAGATGLRRPRLNFASTLTGRVEDEGWTAPDYWSRQMLQPVRFCDAIRALRERGANVFVEIGPGSDLTAMGAAQAVPGEVWLSSLRAGCPDRLAMLEGVGRLYGLGVGIDWQGFQAGRPFERAVLPRYPFERSRYWVEGPARSATPARPAAGGSPWLGRLAEAPGGRDLRFQAYWSGEWPKPLEGLRQASREAIPASTRLALAVAAAHACTPGPEYLLKDLSLQGQARELADQALLVSTVLSPGQMREEAAAFEGFTLECFGAATEQAAHWQPILMGKVVPAEAAVARLQGGPADGREGRGDGAHGDQARQAPLNESAWTTPGEEELVATPPEDFYRACERLGAAYAAELRVLKRFLAAPGRAVGLIATEPSEGGGAAAAALEGCLQVLGGAAFTLDPGRAVRLRRVARLAWRGQWPERFYACAEVRTQESEMEATLRLIAEGSSEPFADWSGLQLETVEAEGKSKTSKELQRFAELEAAEREAFLLDVVVGAACMVLRREDGALIDSGETFQRLGMDSLMALEMANRLDRKLGVRLPVGRFLGEVTLDGVSREILGRIEQGGSADSEETWVEGVL